MSELMATMPGVVLGRFHGIDEDGRLRVVLPGSKRPVPARAAWMPVTPDWSACAGLRVLLALVDGDADHPVILGLLDAPAVVAAPEAATSSVDAAADPNPQAHPEILRLQAKRELILECGKARVSLRADGRVVILGGYLVSRSSGVNKIKGASVQIN